MVSAQQNLNGKSEKALPTVVPGTGPETLDICTVTPQILYQFLSQHVIGNEEVKKAIATFIFRHIERTGLARTPPRKQGLATKMICKYFEPSREWCEEFEALVEDLKTRRDAYSKRGGMDPRYQNKLYELLEEGLDNDVIRLLPTANADARKELKKRKKSSKKNNNRAKVKVRAKDRKNKSKGSLPKWAEAFAAEFAELGERHSASSFIDERIKKRSLLAIGPSGTGKTMPFKILCKALGIPFAIVDVSSATQSGYEGGNIKSMVANALLESADGDAERAQLGIVVLDELCKLRPSHDNFGVDVGGKGVLFEALSIFEGGYDQETEVSFQHASVCALGVFEGLTKAARKALNIESKVGFGKAPVLNGTDDENAYDPTLLRGLPSNKMDKALKEWGFEGLSEFLGRVSSIVFTDNQDKERMYRILTESRSSAYEEAQYYLARQGVDFSLTDKGLRLVAFQASKSDTNARALDRIFTTLTKALEFRYGGTKKEGSKPTKVKFGVNKIYKLLRILKPARPPRLSTRKVVH